MIKLHVAYCGDFALAVMFIQFPILISWSVAPYTMLMVDTYQR